MNINSHKDLKVWQESMELVLDVYALSELLPGSERYGLTSQIQRAAISIPSNIAEGCGRKGSKELTRFLYMAMGSLSELETQIEIISRLNYVIDEGSIQNRIVYIRRMLSKLIKSLAS